MTSPTDPGAALRRRLALRAAHRLGLPLREGNAVSPLPGGAGLEAQRALLRGARSSLLFEIYIWEDDAVGRGFLELLLEARHRGVFVAGIVDALGSWGADRMLAELRAAGAQLLRFHPVAPWRPLHVWNRRNHRKLLIADGQEAVVGSANWSLDYEPGLNPEAFLDLGVALRGPSVVDLAADFGAVWRRSGGAPLELPLAEPGSRIWPGPWMEDATVQVVSSAAKGGRRPLRRHLRLLLSQVQQELLIANAYFVPGAPQLRRLLRLLRRGARLELLLPGRSDQPFVQAAGRSCYGKLLEAGARVFEREARMLHAKAALFDGELAVLGSANLDPRSFRHNLELNLAVRHPAFAEALRRIFEAQLPRSRELRAAEWKKRPLAARLWERFAYLFRYWL